MVEIAAIIVLLGYILLAVKKPRIAMITSLPVGALLFIQGWHNESLLTVILGPMVFLAVIFVCLIEAKIRILKLMGLFFLVVVGIAACLAVIGSIVYLMGPAAIWGILWFIVLIGMIVGYNVTAQKSIALDIVSTLGACMRQNLPLATALESEAAGMRGKRYRILGRISRWLSEGYPLSEALKRGFPRCPGDIVAMIAMAESVNQVPLAIKAIETDMLAGTFRTVRVRPIHPLYPFILLSASLFIILGLIYFVIPKFDMIFKDFGFQLPGSTQALLKTTKQLKKAELMWPVLFFLLVGSGLAYLYALFRPRRAEQPHSLSRIGDFLKWHAPILHWFENNYSLARTTEYLSLSLNAGVTVDRAIGNTLGLDVNQCFKKRLRNWRDCVEAGENISISARQSGLGRTLAWAFDSDLHPGQTPTILKTLEEFYRHNYSYAVNLARFIGWPCLMLCIGMLLGFVVYAFFSPIVAMIQQSITYFTP
jgi:type IV pilus assembly protein PilC